MRMGGSKKLPLEEEGSLKANKTHYPGIMETRSEIQNTFAYFCAFDVYNAFLEIAI